MRKYLAQKRTTKQIKKLLENYPDKVMLNVGCGTDYKEGWINIDNNSDHNIEANRLDLNWDLRNSLPFPDDSVDFIFNEHFMEHLTVEEGQAAIKDLMRVLKPGGVMRIAMPDLEEAIEAYQDPHWKENLFLEKFGLGFVQTKAELINMKFRWWGHKWLYNWEELERRLKEAGCSKMKRCELRRSKFSELRGLEIRDESGLIAEITK